MQALDPNDRRRVGEVAAFEAGIQCAAPCDLAA